MTSENSPRMLVKVHGWSTSSGKTWCSRLAVGALVGLFPYPYTLIGLEAPWQEKNELTPISFAAWRESCFPVSKFKFKAGPGTLSRGGADSLARQSIRFAAKEHLDGHI